MAGEAAQRLPGQLLRDQRLPAQGGGPQGGPDRRNRPLAVGPLQAAPAGAGDQHRRAGGIARPERQGDQVAAAGQDPHAQDRRPALAHGRDGRQRRLARWPLRHGRHGGQDRGGGFRPPEQHGSQARPVAQQGLLQGGEDSLDCRRVSGGHQLLEGDARHRNRQRLEAGRRQARARSSTLPRPPASPMP